MAATPEPLLPLRDIPTDLKPKPLAEALTEWAELTGYQIVVPQSKAAERLSPHIKGKMTAQESLDRLLAGTGLGFEKINDRTLAIVEDFSVPFEPVEPEQKPVMVASLERVEVTGSRLPMDQVDIKANGSPLTPAAVTVFSRNKLDRLGVSQTSDFLDYLPQAPFRVREFQSSAQFAQTRGLGYDNTLVLINGRRTLPSSLTVSWNAFDLNTVPPAAVDRIEVLSDSASAVYGSDAIGGVVNIITKKYIRDTTLDFDYGTANGGGNEQRAALLSGYSNETVRASVIMEYFDRSFLHGTRRDRLRNQDFRRFGGNDYRFLQTNPGNIHSLTSANLPGLPAQFAAVPTTNTGNMPRPEDFLATAGQQNKDSLFKYSSILPELERKGANASIEVDIAPNVSIVGEALYVSKATTGQAQPDALRNALVPATNPFNPFGVAVAVDYLFSSIGPVRFEEHSEMSRALAGLRGSWRDWDWELSVLRSEDKGSTRRINEVDLTRAAAALSATNPAEALNVFQAGTGGSPELLSSLIVDPRTGRYASTGRHISAVVHGSLFDLPAGELQMVGGGEWRTEGVLYDKPNLAGAPGSVVVVGDRNVSAVFGELRLPLVAGEMAIPAINELSLTLAARQDHYSDFGNTLNPQYGLVWKPIPDVALRASYGTSFRAPPQYDLFLPTTTINFGIPDPLRNGQLTNVTVAAGGNPNLKPTDARSASAGVLITPNDAPGLQIAATYWRIEMEKLVGIPPLFTLAASSEMSDSGGRVVRAERTAADIAAGLPGVLTYIDLSRINAGNLKTAGIDFAARYYLDTLMGQFEPTLAATWVKEYETVIFPGEQPLERTGVANRNGSIPRWRVVGSLDWSLRGLTLSTTTRYTPHYWDTNGLDQVVNRRVQAQTLVDIQASLDFGSLFGERSRWSGFKTTAGISNLFDKEPGFSEVQKELGFDPSQGDLRQRFGYIRFSKRF